MKKVKQIVVIAVGVLWCGDVLYGMESNNYSVVINGTTISLIQGNPYKPERDNVTITIAGYYQQDELHEPCLCDPGACSDIMKPFYGKYVYVPKELKKKKFEAVPLPNSGVDCIKWNNILLHVVEPVIYKRGKDQKWFYHAKRRIDENTISDPEYGGDEALVNAKLDLTTCYNQILERSHTFFSQEITDQKRNLMVPSISTATLNKQNDLPYKDAASIACLNVMGFVVQEENKNVYNLIQFILGPNDFPWYYKYFKRFNDLNTDSAAVKDASYYNDILRQIEQDGEAAVK